MPVDNLIEFIIYIIPGFLNRQTYYAWYPRRKKSDFVEITWSIIYGVVIYTLVVWLDKNYFSYFLVSNSSSFPNFMFIFVLLFSGFIFGIISILIHKLRFKITLNNPKLKLLGMNISPDPHNMWEQINRDSNIDWSVVYLADGSMYRGWISNYNLDPNIENQDFILSHASRVDDNLQVM